MNIARQIEYLNARNYFKEAESKGEKLFLGNMNTNFWLHKERINLDFVLESARNLSDARVFIISEGINKGFYIYSEARKICIQLVDDSHHYSHAEIA
jgi:hypothetical protein